jgi:chemotaxis protein CheD
MGLAKVLRKSEVAEWQVSSGDCRFSESACRLTTSGLGSEVVIVAQAPEIGVSAMLRFVHPDSRIDPAKAKHNPWLFADTGISLLLATLRKFGADHSDLRLHAVGAANLSDEGPYGRSNELALRKTLWAEGVLLHHADLGSEVIRSVWFDSGSNRLLVRSQQSRTNSLEMLFQHRAS